MSIPNLSQQLNKGIVGKAQIGAAERFGQDGRAGESQQLCPLGAVGRQHQRFTGAFEDGSGDAPADRLQENQPAVLQVDAHGVPPDVEVRDLVALDGVQSDAVQLVEQIDRRRLCRGRDSPEQSRQQQDRCQRQGWPLPVPPHDSTLGRAGRAGNSATAPRRLELSLLESWMHGRAIE